MLYTLLLIHTRWVNRVVKHPRRNSLLCVEYYPPAVRVAVWLLNSSPPMESNRYTSELASHSCTQVQHHFIATCACEHEWPIVLDFYHTCLRKNSFTHSHSIDCRGCIITKVISAFSHDLSSDLRWNLESWLIHTLSSYQVVSLQDN